MFVTCAKEGNYPAFKICFNRMNATEIDKTHVKKRSFFSYKQFCKYPNENIIVGERAIY